MRSYSTNFSAVESPISESGNWENTVSATWNHPVITTSGTPNFAHAPGASSTNDGVARLTGTWFKNQQCSGVVGNIGVGFLAAELELHVLMTMLNGPDQIFTYEWDIINTGNASSWVRWNGAQGNFTVLGAGGVLGGLSAGDILLGRATVGPTGTLLEGFLNGVLKETFFDTSSQRLLSGNPGMGFDNEAGTDTIAFTSYSARDFAPGPVGRFIAPVLLW